jgi:hypothetical protein
LILARNEYKSTEKEISVIRNKTPEEIRLEKEEKERIENEIAQKKIDELNGYISDMKKGYEIYSVNTIISVVD